MIADVDNHVIVHQDRHGIAVYACTLDNALRLAEEAASHHSELATAYQQYLEERDGGPTLWTVEMLVSALSELLDGKEGDSLPKLRRRLYGREPAEGVEDTRPEVRFNEAWQQELVLWLFQHRAALQGASGGTRLAEVSCATLAALQPLDTLSFMAPAKARRPQGIKLVDRTYLHGAEELYVLRSGKWKEAASAHRVINRHLRFAQEWGGGTLDVHPILPKS